ncbi:MAG: hypothetical protein V4641_09765 [Pseudomonadota bacterium]
MSLDQKELKTLLKLCRQQGVTEIAFEGVSIKFGDLPPPKPGKKDADDDDDDAPDPNVDPMTGLTLEQLANYSVNNGAQ